MPSSKVRFAEDGASKKVKEEIIPAVKIEQGEVVKSEPVSKVKEEVVKSESQKKARGSILKKKQAAPLTEPKTES